MVERASGDRRLEECEVKDETKTDSEKAAMHFLQFGSGVDESKPITAKREKPAWMRRVASWFRPKTEGARG
jgi:hypothetical protein